MKRARWWCLGLAVVVGFTGVGQTAAAGSPDTKLSITIHVYNYAGVDQKTIREAETVTSGIFRKAGIEIRWIDGAPALDNHQEPATDHGSVSLIDISLNIPPSAMADRLQPSHEVMGLAPGVGRDRHRVYVFYNRIDRINDAQLLSNLDGIYVRTSQTLGHAIAHEVGHLLLNTEVHSQTGIMRGNWGLEDLREVACGRLLFTSQQAEVIRAEVIRRIGQHQTLEVAGLESPTLAR